MKNSKINKEISLYNYINKQHNTIKVALIYPNTYYVGMSNLGFQSIYHYLNSENDITISRFFYDNKSINMIYSPENNFELYQADIILLSQSFELDCLNFINILSYNSIPPKKHDRKANHPLIIGGGILPTMNHLIYKDIVDSVFFGEIEPNLEFLKSMIKMTKTSHKHLITDKIKKKFGEEKLIDKLSIRNIDEYSIPVHTSIITKNTSFSNMFLIEITRGCKYACSFCLVSRLYKKFRHYHTDMILSEVKKALTYTKQIGLVSALTTEHPDLVEIVKKINEQGGIVNFSSLRIDSIDDEMLDLMRENGQNILTIAPETASKKVKKSFGKNILNDNVIDIVLRAVKKHIKKIKIYFIIGFQEETEKDIEENIKFVKQIKDSIVKMNKLHYMPHIIINISPFVPKPFTKMETSKQLHHKEIEKRMKYMKKELLKLGGIKIHTESPKLSYIQSLISLGDSDVGEALIKMSNDKVNIRHLNRYL